MKDININYLQTMQAQLSQQRAILYSILGQEELLNRFIASLYSDKKITQEAYKMYCMISQDRNNQKNVIRFQLQSQFGRIYKIKELFYAFEQVHKQQIYDCQENLPGFTAYNELKEYFEQEILEEIEEIPDELPHE